MQWVGAHLLQALSRRKGKRRLKTCGCHHCPYQQFQRIVLHIIGIHHRHFLKSLIENTNRFLSHVRSPVSHRRESNTERTRITDSPGSMSPSVQSSEERPRSRIASHISGSHISRPQSQPSRSGKFYTFMTNILILTYFNFSWWSRGISNTFRRIFWRHTSIRFSRSTWGWNKASAE